MSGRRGFFNQVGYTLTIIETGKTVSCDSLADAKLTADWEIDPNWEG